MNTAMFLGKREIQSEDNTLLLVELNGAVEYLISMEPKSSGRDPGHEREGMFKKVRPARPQPF